MDSDRDFEGKVLPYVGRVMLLILKPDPMQGVLESVSAWAPLKRGAKGYLGGRDS